MDRGSDDVDETLHTRLAQALPQLCAALNHRPPLPDWQLPDDPRRLPLEAQERLTAWLTTPPHAEPGPHHLLAPWQWAWNEAGERRTAVVLVHADTLGLTFSLCPWRIMHGTGSIVIGWMRGRGWHDPPRAHDPQCRLTWALTHRRRDQERLFAERGSPDTWLPETVPVGTLSYKRHQPLETHRWLSESLVLLHGGALDWFAVWLMHASVRRSGSFDLPAVFEALKDVVMQRLDPQARRLVRMGVLASLVWASEAPQEEEFVLRALGLVSPITQPARGAAPVCGVVTPEGLCSRIPGDTGRRLCPAHWQCLVTSHDGTAAGCPWEDIPDIMSDDEDDDLCDRIRVYLLDDLAFLKRGRRATGCELGYRRYTMEVTESIADVARLCGVNYDEWTWNWGETADPASRKKMAVRKLAKTQIARIIQKTRETCPNQRQVIVLWEWIVQGAGHVTLLKIDNGCQRSFLFLDANSGQWVPFPEKGGAQPSTVNSYDLIPKVVDVQDESGHRVRYRHVVAATRRCNYQGWVEPPHGVDDRNPDGTYSRAGVFGNCTLIHWLVFLCAWRFRLHDLHLLATHVASVFREARSSWTDFETLYCGALDWQNEIAMFAKESRDGARTQAFGERMWRLLGLTPVAADAPSRPCGVLSVTKTWVGAQTQSCKKTPLEAGHVLCPDHELKLRSSLSRRRGGGAGTAHVDVDLHCHGGWPRADSDIVDLPAGVRVVLRNVAGLCGGSQSVDALCVPPSESSYNDWLGSVHDDPNAALEAFLSVMAKEGGHIQPHTWCVLETRAPNLTLSWEGGRPNLPFGAYVHPFGVTVEGTDGRALATLRQPWALQLCTSASLGPPMTDEVYNQVENVLVGLERTDLVPMFENGELAHARQDPSGCFRNVATIKDLRTLLRELFPDHTLGGRTLNLYLFVCVTRRGGSPTPWGPAWGVQPLTYWDHSRPSPGPVRTRRPATQTGWPWSRRPGWWSGAPDA